jgi:hypothetical protein
MSSRFTIRDRWTFFLAVGLLAVFFIFFGVAFYYGLLISDPTDYSGIDKVSGSLGIILGAVLGFYFQQERIQSLKEHVQEEEHKGSRARKTVVRTSRDSIPLVNKEIELLKEQLKVKEEIIERLKKK